MEGGGGNVNSARGPFSFFPDEKSFSFLSRSELPSFFSLYTSASSSSRRKGGGRRGEGREDEPNRGNV